MSEEEVTDPVTKAIEDALWPGGEDDPGEEPEVEAAESQDDEEKGEDPEPEQEDPVAKLNAEWEAKLQEKDRAFRGVLSELQEKRKLEQELKRQYEAEQEAKKKAEEEAATPSADENPVEHILAVQRREAQALREEINAKLDAVSSQNEQRQQREQHAQVVQYTQASEQQFLEEHPDYYDAIDHLRRESVSLVKRMNPAITEEQIQVLLTRARDNLIGHALSQGKNPAEAAYEQAITQFGYKPTQNGNAEREAGAADGAHNADQAGSTPAPATKPKSKPKPPSRIPSLSAVPAVSGRGGQKVTKEEFAKMDPFDPTFGKIADNDYLVEQMQRDGYVMV